MDSGHHVTDMLNYIGDNEKTKKIVGETNMEWYIRIYKLNKEKRLAHWDKLIKENEERRNK